MKRNNYTEVSGYLVNKMYFKIAKQIQRIAQIVWPVFGCQLVATRLSELAQAEPALTCSVVLSWHEWHHWALVSEPGKFGLGFLGSAGMFFTPK